MDVHFFSYRVLDKGRIVRIGKGSARYRDRDAVEAYLTRRYRFGWSEFDFQWHSTEAAAFKREASLTDSYERRHGRLPPRNRIGGGGGGSIYVRCKGLLVDGEACRSLAISGNYGFCGRHRSGL
jgi:hypothetical protein